MPCAQKAQFMIIGALIFLLLLLIGWLLVSLMTNKLDNFLIDSLWTNNVLDSKERNIWFIKGIILGTCISFGLTILSIFSSSITVFKSMYRP